jgi:hypothetical protein
MSVWPSVCCGLSAYRTENTAPLSCKDPSRWQTTKAHSISVCYFCLILTKVRKCLQILGKNHKYGISQKSVSRESPAFMRTDTTKLTAAWRSSFGETHKMFQQAVPARTLIRHCSYVSQVLHGSVSGQQVASDCCPLCRLCLFVLRCGV